MRLYRIKNKTTGLCYQAGSYGGRFSPAGTIYSVRRYADEALRGIKLDAAQRGHAANHGVARNDEVIIEEVEVISKGEV